MLACVGGQHFHLNPWLSVFSDNFLLELVFCVSGLWSCPNSEMKAPQKLMILALLDFSGYFSMKQNAKMKAISESKVYNVIVDDWNR